MNKRKRHRNAWAVEWKQVYPSDRDERLTRVFALVLPQAQAKTRHRSGEKQDVRTSRPLRQSVQ
jgi:Zn/Cd-binding protein ZinT